MKYAWLDLQLHSYPVLALCEVLEVSLSGYRSWKRGGTPQRKRLSDIQLLTLIRSVHAEVKGAYGWLCSEGYEFPCYGRDYAFLTQTGLPKAFHKLMMLAMMTPSLSCEAIFCVSRVAPMHRLMREICASTRERRP